MMNTAILTKVHRSWLLIVAAVALVGQDNGLTSGVRAFSPNRKGTFKRVGTGNNGFDGLAFTQNEQQRKTRVHHMTSSSNSAAVKANSSEQDVQQSSQKQQARINVPLTWEEMVSQVSTAIKDARYTQGTTRQIVRLLVPRDSSGEDLLTYYENDVDTQQSSASSTTFLVPPDESWQGGIMQLYRANAPTCDELLRKLTSDQGLPPRIREDRSVDESGVDGVGLFYTEGSENKQKKDMAIWLQPTQEVVDDMVIDEAKRAGKDDLRILINPQWRTVDDALDVASKNSGFLGGLASFLGGKGATQRALADAGFTPTYTLEGYICRGWNIRLMQVLDSEWHVFVQNQDNTEGYQAVGTIPNRPTYQEVEQLLQSSNIGYKFSQSFGRE